MKRNYWKYALVTLMYTGSLYALPPQVEADRLELAAKTAIQSKDYATAIEKLEAIQKLGVKLPDTFHYHYGIVLYEVGRYQESLEMLDKYLSHGQSVKFYKEALEGYNKADEAKNNIFVDSSTGLMWQDSQVAATEKLLIWEDAKNYCTNLNLNGYKDWRLPDIEALKSLYPQSKKLKYITYINWSATTHAGDNSQAWIFEFGTGNGDTSYKYLKNYVRCIRDIK